uniref:Uncharacterized protein n=1 Tax=Arundo donax TaxID=35708 RepID=A0A0A9H5B8_ARUDO
MIRQCDHRQSMMVMTDGSHDHQCYLGVATVDKYLLSFSPFGHSTYSI